ncbi:S8 family serine peptidase [Pontibacter brevis]
MKRTIIPVLTYFTLLLAFTSCRQDGPAPIRNIKAGPNLLKAQASQSFTNYTYFTDQQQKTLGNVYTKEVLVSFVEGLSVEQEQQTLEQYGFVESRTEQVATDATLLHSVALVDGLNCNQVEQALQELAKDPNISYAAPYFRDGNSLVGVSNQVVVTLEKGETGALQRLAKEYNAEVLKSVDEDTYLLKVDDTSKGNALAFANYLHGQKGIAQAEPDFVVSPN